MSLLSEEKTKELWGELSGETFAAFERSVRAIEAAVLEAQGKQEPVAWEVSYKYGHIFLRISDEIFMLAYDPKSEPNTSEKEAADFFMAQLRRAISNIAAPVVQPQQEPVGKPHRWNDDGERCLDCGDKDWMADKYCSAAPVVQPGMVMEGFKAACAFIDSHVADPDITSEMRKTYAEFMRMRAMIAAAEGKE